MGDFAPSVEAARLNSPVPIETKPHPPGGKGVKMSLDEVALRVAKGRNDPRVRSWAIRAIHAAGVGGMHRELEQAEAVRAALKKATSYVQDPLNTEFMQAAAETLCLDDKGYCFRGGDCFPKGTLVLRDDFEFVPIENVKVGDRIWGLDKWTRVEATAYKGTLTVDAIFLNNGSVVQLTGDHHVYVARCDRHSHRTDKSLACSCVIADRRIERIRVSEMRKGDVTLQPSRISFGSKDLDPRLAYVEGLYVSDGSSSKASQFEIAGQDGCPKEAQKREVQSICAALCIPTTWQRKYISVRDRQWTDRMHRMGTHAPQKHLLSINLNKEAAAETLRGVMADSGANTNGPGRTFTTTSHQLMVQTRVLHRMFGTSCGVRYIVDHGGLGENPIWRLGVRKTNGRQDKILRVKAVERSVRRTPCYDIQTEDHYVYLPEHDVTVSQCDDLTIAYASATLSIGIPTNIVGQAFNNSGVPSHVIAAIQDSKSKEWYRVDPSTDKRVGDYVNAKQEWWIDPLDVNDKTSSTVAGAGDFVGVGMIPGARQGYTGVGQGSPASSDVAASAVAQVASVLYDLQTACASAKSGLDQLGSITSVLGFDPEPAGYTITGLSNFPSNGTWTASMDTIAKGLLSQGLFLLSVCQQAYDGARDIYVDATSNGLFFAGQPSDPYYWREVLATATDSIIGIYSPAGVLLYGITQSLGAYLTPSQVQTQQTSAGSTAGAAAGSNAGSATGTQGVGALPVVEVIAIAGVTIVASIATCIIYVKLLQSVISFINMAVLNKIVATAARLYPNDPDKQAAFITKSQQQQIDLANAGTKDPFGSIAQSAADIVKWLAIGGAVIGGGILLAPMIREAGKSAAVAIRSRRLGVRKKVPA